MLWEHKFSVYLSDIPAHRVAWASPSVDPATGNIYTFGGNAALMAFSPDGKLLWERGLVEDFGAITTHGGRTPSPVIDGDLVIVNALISAWGTLARSGNRYFAFDKKTGAVGLGQLAADSATGTPTTPRRSSPRSTARGCSSSAAPTASSTL